MPQKAPRRLNLVYHFIEVTFDQNEEENSFGLLIHCETHRDHKFKTSAVSPV